MKQTKRSFMAVMGSRPDSIAYVVSALCGALVVLPLLGRGLPAYQHDWSWPFSRAGVVAGLLGHLSLWDPNGLGQSNALAGANPLLPIFALLGLVFGAVPSGKIVLLCCVAFSGVGAAWCARRCFGASSEAAVLAAIAYVASPVVLNKIAAGHVGYWCAYALLPWIFERTRAAIAGGWSRSLTLALLCALSTLQPQFALFCLIVVVAAALGYPFMASIRIFGAALAGVCVAMFPTAYALLNARTDIAASFPYALGVSENARSASPYAALLNAHYIVPYYQKVFGRTLLFALSGAAAGLIGLVVSLRKRNGAALAVLLLVGLFFTTGTLGPFAVLWTWLFEHVPFTGAFRELYDASALIALAYALGAAIAFRGAAAQRAIVAALVVFAATPLLIGKLSVGVHNIVDDDPPFSAAMAQRPNGRILPLPLLTPLARNGSEPGGLDLFAPRDPTHPALTEYPMQFPLTGLALSGSLGDRWWQRWVETTGAVAAVTRPNYRSDQGGGTAGTAAGNVFSFVPINGHAEIEFVEGTRSLPLSFKSVTAGDVMLSAPLDPLPGDGGPPSAIVPVSTLRTDDPSEDWVSLDRSRGVSLDPAATMRDGLVTVSERPLQIAVPDGQWWLLAQARGVVRIEQRGFASDMRLAGPTWVPLSPSPGTITVRSIGGAAVVYRVARGSSDVPAGPFGSAAVLRVMRSLPWSVSVDVASRSGDRFMLIFRDRYSDAWRVSGAQTLWHGIADGYANAFLLAEPKTNIRIEYAPQRAFLVLVLLCWLMYGATIFAAVWLYRAERRPPQRAA
ncbi:MAG: hypothetical protein JO233_03805 [Candidatus Eremiobacteraeota bacterium]|nr:hypothetical protein [Candidatus Eremiobacteraeota bacterium]